MKQKKVKLYVGRDEDEKPYLRGYHVCTKKMSRCDCLFFHHEATYVCPNGFHKLFDLRLKPGEQVQIEVTQVECKILKKFPKEKP